MGNSTGIKTNFDAAADRYRATPVGNIVTTGLLLHLDAANATRGLAFPSIQCPLTASWFDLSSYGRTSWPYNFGLDTPCSASSGRNGSGVVGDAYRAVFGGENPYQNHFSVFYSSLPTTNISEEVWFSSTATSAEIFSSDEDQGSDAGTDDHSLYLNNSGNLCHYLAYQSTTQTICTSGAYHGGNWHHVLVTIQSGVGQTIYVDGASQASGNLDTGLGTGNYFDIGAASPSGTPNWYQGSIAKVAIYGSVLSSAQIKQNCQAIQSRFSASAICP